MPIFREVIAVIVKLDILETIVKQVGKYRSSLFFPPFSISTGNSMTAIVITDLHYERYLKILSKLYKPLGKCNLEEFLKITTIAKLS